MKLQRTVLCFILVGCKYGGSDADPLQGLEPGARSDEPGTDDGTITTDASLSSPSTTPSTPGGKTPTTGSDATDTKVPTTGGGMTPSTGAGDAGLATGRPSAPADGCGPATPVATCDPVRNTGCPPLTQCDIETSATSPTGRCVFFQATPGVPCSSSFVNVTCDAQNTCVGGECRKMCYCDSDCAPGNCCQDTSGPGPSGAFKLCRPC